MNFYSIYKVVRKKTGGQRGREWVGGHPVASFGFYLREGSQS